MDFLNPQKQKRNRIQLTIGYVLIVVALFLTTLILVFTAEGYGFGKDGQIIQNGLVFVSSAPNPAKIYLNGTYNGSTTNTRLQLPAGQYTLKLVRSGYRPWVRSLGIEGGSVEHFDYPFLVPTNLVTTNLAQYSAEPSLVTESPDRHWLLAASPSNINSFTMYDLSNVKQLQHSTVNLPAGILTSTTGTQSWQLVEWSTDSRHVLLKHIYKGGSEYIMLDTQTPADSLNLTKTLKLSSQTELSLYNKKYNQYYLYDTKTLSLTNVSLSNTQPVPMLNDVLNFKTYGNGVVLYVTTQNAPTGYVEFDVLDGSSNYEVKQEKAGSNYLLNITQYQGNWYAAFGAASDNKIYVYENPMQQPQDTGLPLVPVYILKINNPDNLTFSATAQFIMAEHGDEFSVYDIENQKGYAYKLDLPLSSTETAQWMDGDRLTLISGGKIIMFDYDNANRQTLQPAVVGYGPLFDTAYKWSFALAPSGQKTAPYALTETALRAPADQ